MTTTTVRPTRAAGSATQRSLISDWWSIASVRWATVALCLFLAGLTAQLLNAPSGMWWTLYLACYVTGGWAPAWEGLRALRSRTLDVDLLIGQMDQSLFKGYVLYVVPLVSDEFDMTGCVEIFDTRADVGPIRTSLEFIQQLLISLPRAHICFCGETLGNEMPS